MEISRRTLRQAFLPAVTVTVFASFNAFGESRDLAKEVADHRAKVARAMAETHNGMRERREAAEERWEVAGREQTAQLKELEQAAAEKQSRKSWYWAKQCSLVGSVLGAGVAQLVLSRRKRKDPAWRSGPVGSGKGSGELTIRP